VPDAIGKPADGPDGSTAHARPSADRNVVKACARIDDAVAAAARAVATTARGTIDCPATNATAHKIHARTPRWRSGVPIHA
jgi:hypothetical protein